MAGGDNSVRFEELPIDRMLILFDVANCIGSLLEVGERY